MVAVVVVSPSTHVRAGEQGIFTQLATIVAEQGEMMQRIDANINEVRFPFYLSFQGTRTDAQTTRHGTPLLYNRAMPTCRTRKRSC
jgi:hypothetical protein